jgi:hypothetical protein
VDAGLAFVNGPRNQMAAFAETTALIEVGVASFLNAEDS